MLDTHDLRNAGLKVTLPRVKILQILENQVNERHLTAEQVYKILLSEMKKSAWLRFIVF
jgi:Ferric uptake regulator family.